MNRAAALVIAAASAVTCADTRPDDASLADASSDGGSAPADATSDWAAESGSTAKDATPPVLPDSGLPSEHAWLDDPDIWEHAPGTEFLWPRCYEFLGKSDKLKFPALVWEGCGAGCALASMDQGFPRNGRAAEMTTHRIAGQTRTLLSVSVAVLGEGWNHVATQVIDLETATCIGGRLQRSTTNHKYAPCMMGSGDVPGQTTNGGAYDSETDTFLSQLTFDVATQTWLRAEPERLNSQTETGLASIYLDQGHVRLLTGKGAVYAMLDPAKHEYTVLQPSSKSYLGDGDGDLAVWIDSKTAPGQKLNGWAPDGNGMRVIAASPPPTTCRVAVSPTSIVGWSTDGGCDDFGTLRFFRMPRAYVDGSPITQGPELGGELNLSNIKSWGDYAMVRAARLVGAEITHFVLVVRLSDWKTWRIDPTPGYAGTQHAWGLSDTHAYIGEGGTSANDVHETKHIRRIALDALDNFATHL